jgi:calcium-dependent protein kinase
MPVPALLRVERVAHQEKSSRRTPSRVKSHKFRAQDFVRKRKNETLTDHYTVGKLLGEGQFGEVFIGTVKQSNGGKGDNRAIKRIQKELLTEEDHDEVFNEFTLLKQMDHPNICKMYEFFEDKENFWFVQELCSGGELLDELERMETFPEAAAALIVKQVLSSVHYCHSQKRVVHRDLKLENILLEEGTQKTEDGGYNLASCKLIDFGLATTFEVDQVLTSPVGSMHYIAPEVLEQSYGYKCDIWSCGVIAYILLCGYAPFDAANDRDMRELIMMGNVSFDDAVWQNNVSQEAKEFVSYLLTYEPEKRPDAGEALQHPWIKNASKIHAEQFKATKSGTDAAVRILTNCRSFEAASKLKQATCAFMASQLVLSGDAADHNSHTNDNADPDNADPNTADPNTAMMIGEIFRAIDLDSDGRISPEELRLGLLDFLGESAGLTVEEADDIFRRMDLSFTGYIDYSEFVVASMGLHDQHEVLLKQAFERLLDKDGSGFISHEKLRKEMEPFYGEDVEEETIQKIIDQADADQDGQISWADFQGMMSRTADFFPPEDARPLSRHKEQLKEVEAVEASTAEQTCSPLEATPVVASAGANEGDAGEKCTTDAESGPLPQLDATAAEAEKFSVDATTKTPPTPGRKVRSSVGPKARLISAMFEKNLEKNREMGFDNFSYTRKQPERKQKRTLPRTRRVNFEELTKKANTQVNFDARAARAGRSKEIEQLTTPGRARERRATIASMFKQEKQDSKRRESRMLELQAVTSQSNATDRRERVRHSLQETNALKVEQTKEQRSAELKTLWYDDIGARKRLFEMWNRPPPSVTPSSAERRASQVQRLTELKRFQTIFDQVDQSGSLKERFARHRPSLATSALPQRSRRGWTKRLSGKSLIESIDGNSKDSSQHSRRGLDRSSSHTALSVLEDLEERLVRMQPAATDGTSARLIEPIRRVNSFDSIADCDECDQRLDGLLDDSTHVRPGPAQAEARVILELPDEKSSAPPRCRVWSYDAPNTRDKKLEHVQHDDRQQGVNTTPNFEQPERGSPWVHEHTNASVSQIQEKRASRLEELQQLLEKTSGGAKSAREQFEENIRANKRAMGGPSRSRSVTVMDEAEAPAVSVSSPKGDKLHSTACSELSGSEMRNSLSLLGPGNLASISCNAGSDSAGGQLGRKQQRRNSTGGFAGIGHVLGTEECDAEDSNRDSITWHKLQESKSAEYEEPEDSVDRGCKSAQDIIRAGSNSLSNIEHLEDDANNRSVVGLHQSGDMSITDLGGKSMNSMFGSVSEIPASPGGMQGMLSPTRQERYERPAPRDPNKQIVTPRNMPRFVSPTTPNKANRAYRVGGKFPRRASASPTMTAPSDSGVTEVQAKFLEISNERAEKALVVESTALADPVTTQAE